jgi:hypothetical protein
MPGIAGDNPHSRARNGENAKSCEAGENIPGDARHPRHPEPDSFFLDDPE